MLICSFINSGKSQVTITLSISTPPFYYEKWPEGRKTHKTGAIYVVGSFTWHPIPRGRERTSDSRREAQLWPVGS